MKTLVIFLPMLIVGIGTAYAEPLGNIQASVLDYSNNTATIKVTWDPDESVSSYQIGCVSCFPNIVNSTSENSIIINNVTPFPNSSISMLYGIAYNFENQILVAKQIIVNLAQ